MSYRKKKFIVSDSPKEYFIYNGLGLYTDDIPFVGTSIISYEYTIQGLVYRARRIDGGMFKFELVLEDHRFCEGTTARQQFTTFSFDRTAIEESRNFDFDGNIISEVFDGFGKIILPLRETAFKHKERVSAVYEISNRSIKQVCFLNKQIPNIVQNDVVECETWLK